MTKPSCDANQRWLGFLLAALVAVLVTLFGAGTASAATATAAQTRVGPHTLVTQVVVGPDGGIGAGQRLGNDPPAYDSALATGVAAKAAGGLDIAGAKFAQRSFSETFSKGGLFGGRTIDDVAGSLKSGAMSPKEVPINVVVRGGNTLITNTRSAQALTRAGVPRGSWNVIDRTGSQLYEDLLNGQLTRNGLGSGGVDLP